MLKSAIILYWPLLFVRLLSGMTAYRFPNQTAFYQGKVRDVYTINNKWLVLVASNRISAFDVILPRPIPYKGQVLNQIASYMLKATSDICPNWFIQSPAPQVAIGKKCKPFKIEVVVRGNLSGHAWRTYQAGQRVLCGAYMPDGLKENDFFLQPIITPSTKATTGHDEDISPSEIIEQGLTTETEWEQISQYALALFNRGKEMAAAKGLILVDTKYEFGTEQGVITLMDEIHTPDSSRFFYAAGFADKQLSGQKQEQLSKEFVREWLIANHFMGKAGQQVPLMNDEWVQEISNRYILLYEKVTGEKFVPCKISAEETEGLTKEALHRIIANYK